MAIFYHRDVTQAESTAYPVAALTQDSSFIKSWHSSLQKLFFNKEGMMVDEVSCYPNFIINHMDVDHGVGIWVFIEPSNLSAEHTFYDFKTLIYSHIIKILQLVKEHPANSQAVIYKRVFGSASEIMRLEERHFMQFSASLLNLYKDILKISRYQIEERKLVTLQERLEHLVLTTEKTDSLNTMKAMILEMRECSIFQKEYEDKAKLDPIMWQRQLLDELQIKYQVFSPPLGGFEMKIPDNFIAQCTDWLMHLPEKKIVCVCINSWKRFPKTLLINVLRSRSSRVLISILQMNLKVFSVFLPLDLLKKALKAMLIDDVKIFWDQFVGDELIGILQEMSGNLLDKIFLELPYDMLYNLKEKVLSISLEKEIQECFVELKKAYKKKYNIKKINESVIPSLRSLAASAICRAPHSSLVGQGYQALSPISLERILLTSPRIQEEVRSQVRVQVKIPIVEGSPEFIFEDVLGPDYLSELDLLSLASLAEGYRVALNKVLAERCMQD
ncbi:hypothetical protein CLAVI_000317 [Candidatus Clavichlamydia salmonicola]|uniref:hypothetical protein n=1 Tax=Candidatus Clavichlamydia salmonicola TaxID=469812 RepID=UPI001891EDF4|nr:hypothetical protein [Candidatus Clavichlamydia salmonicola]MBF5050702.1 hypothetical protein [Candidatus Clavichlamydia salmonicola]